MEAFMKNILRNKPYCNITILLGTILVLCFAFLFVQNANAEEPPIDTEAPSAPTNLAAVYISTTSVSLTWVESTDNVAVTSYEVYKDLALAQTTTGTSITFTNLIPHTTYSFFTIAKDEAGNASVSSGAIEVTTNALTDIQAPTMPSNLTAAAISATSVQLSWGASTDDSETVWYELYKNNELAATTTTTSLTVDSLTSSTEYSFHVIAKDATGNFSEPSNSLFILTLLNTPSNISSTILDSFVKLSWESVVGAEGYDVEVDGTIVNNGSSTTYTNTGLAPGTQRNYRIRAINSNNRSEWTQVYTYKTLSNVNVSGTISTDTTWITGNIYTVQSNLTIAQDKQLQIQPGVIVRVQPGATITVNGKINAIGTISSRILFTSSKDPYCGGTGVTASSDYWKAIYVKNTGEFITDYTTMAYGGYYLYSSSYRSIVDEGKVSINNSIIRNTYRDALVVNTTCDLFIRNSIIENCSGSGILISSFGTGLLDISDNTIQNNAGYAVYCNLSNLGTSIFSGINRNTFINNIYSGLNYDSVLIEGTLKTNIALTNNINAYLTKNITIPVGYVLSVEAGIVLKSDYYTNKIQVDGTLDAAGTLGNQVVFTAIRDEDYGGIGGTNYLRYWNGISVNATGEFIGNYVRIRYAGSNVGEKAIDIKGKLNLSNSEIIRPYSYGINISGACDAKVNNCRIIDATKNGINFETTASGKFEIENSSIENSFNSAVFINGNCDVSLDNTHINGTANTGVYINTTGAGNLNFTDNTIENCGYHGIYLAQYGIGSFTFKNNSVNNNTKGYPFYIELDALKSSIFGGISNNTFSNNVYLSKNYDSIVLTGSPTIDLQLTKNKYYFNYGTFTIQQNKTLYIKAGTEIRFCNLSSLLVNGNLNAEGTLEQPIIFTSYNDSKKPSMWYPDDYWRGIKIGSTGVFTGDYLKIKNGANYLDSMIYVEGKLTLTNSVISNSFANGIYFSTSIQPTLSFNTFRNHPYAVYNASPAAITIDASYNYWDSVYGPGYNKKNKVTSGVDYEPWLGQEFKYQFHNGSSGVYAPTGNYSRTFTDLSLASPGLNIDISRTYNSNDTRQNSSMGPGWTFGFESSIKDYALGAPLKVIRLPDGSVITFKSEDDGTYTADNSRNILEKQEDGTFILTTKDQHKYYFNTSGYLSSIIDRNGNTTTITVDNDGKVLGITDQVQRCFTISYENGLIKRISDPAGRTVQYSYTDGKLTEYTDPAGYVTHYSYDAQGSLCTIRDNSMHIVESILYDRTTGENHNKVTSKTDIYGNILNYTYDNINKKVTITDSNNRETIQWFDDSMFVTNTRDPEGKVVTTEYFLDADGVNNLGEVKSSTDRNGKKTKYEIDGNGNITKVTNPDSSTRGMTYDLKNNLLSIKDELGKYTWMVYDQDGINLVKRAQPINGTDVYNGADAGFAVTSYNYYTEQENQQYSYLAKGLVKTITDPENNTTTYAYDSYGNNTVVTDPENNQIVSECDILGRKIKVTNANGYVTTFAYDISGNLEKQILDNNETTRITYDFRGNKTKEVSPNQYDPAMENPADHTYNGDHGYRYTYYDNGKLRAVTDPENNTTSYTYDIYGNVVAETKPNGTVYTYEYDVMNRVVKSYFTDVNSSPILLEEYDYIILADGNTQKVVTKHLNSSEVAVTSFKYDYAGRQIEQKNPDNTTLKTEYYQNGLTKTTTDAKSNISYFYYDGLNRLIEEKVPFEKISATTYYTITKKEYDKNGNILLEKTTCNKPGQPETYNQTGYEYNDRNLLVKVTMYDNDLPENYTQYFYDADGNKIRMYTGLSQPLLITGLDNVIPQSDSTYSTAKYTYNHLGKLSSMTDALNSIVTYGYDLNGNNTAIIDRNGNTTTLTYDNMNRLLSKTVACSDSTCNAAYSYTYDSMGDVLTTTGGEISYTYGYDGMGRLTSETQSDGFTKEYAYDTAGRKVSFKLYQDGVLKQDLSYTYYITSRLRQVMENGSVTATYQYDESGNRSSLAYANGNSTTYTYNLTNKLKVLTNKNGGTTISQYTYNYYLDGNQQSKSDSSGTTSYIYDGLGRLTNVSEPGSIITAYQYDDSNNRDYMSVAGGTDSYTTTYSYDLNNRLTSECKTTSNSAITTDYSYDANGNQIVKGTETYKYDGFNQLIRVDNGVICSYTYDGNGLRTSKTIGDVTTVQIWDGGQVVYETDDDGVLIGSYIRGINLIKSFNASGAAIHYLFNGHGDVVQLTGSSGNVIKAYDYDAFGNEKTPDPADANSFRYCGEYIDKETGSIYLRARYYDPTIGRFISEDSYFGKDSDPLSLNLYTYCANNPINAWDPTGHRKISDDNFGIYGTGKSIPSTLYDLENDSKYSIGTQNKLAELTLSWYESNDESSKNAVLTMINIIRIDANDQYLKEAIEKFTDNCLNDNFGGGLLTEPILQWAGISENALNEKYYDIWGAQLGTINPFKGKSAQQIDRMFREKGFEAKGADPANGKGGYVNPKTGRSYYIDEGGQYKKGFEAPHVDINRDSFKGNKFNLPKLKMFR
jgi:RHS repeat-associated protein